MCATAASNAARAQLREKEKQVTPEQNGPELVCDTSAHRWEQLYVSAQTFWE